jgi:hypothetical protein
VTKDLKMGRAMKRTLGTDSNDSADFVGSRAGRNGEGVVGGDSTTESLGAAKEGMVTTDDATSCEHEIPIVGKPSRRSQATTVQPSRSRADYSIKRAERFDLKFAEGRGLADCRPADEHCQPSSLSRFQMHRGKIGICSAINAFCRWRLQRCVGKGGVTIRERESRGIGARNRRETGLNTRKGWNCAVDARAVC